jgi:hypothetical protein
VVSSIPSYRVVPIATYECRNGLDRRLAFSLVGRGQAAVEMQPGPPEPRWPSALAGTAAVGLAGAAWWAGGHLIAALWIVTAAADAWLFWRSQVPLLTRVRRLLPGMAPPDHIRTIAITAPGQQARPFLACLAMIGSLVDRLSVFDPLVRQYLTAILENSPGIDVAETALVLTDRGLWLRLVAVTPTGSSSGLSDLLSDSVDGVVHLVDRRHGNPAPEATCPQAALDLAACLNGLLDARAHDTASALESLRAAFTGEDSGAANWTVIFEHLWAPAQRILDGTAMTERAAGTESAEAEESGAAGTPELPSGG